jgi:hypothetical protein
MNRFFVAACVASILSLSSSFASSAVAGNVHKTVVVRPNGSVVKKSVFVPGPHYHVRPAVVVKSSGVIVKPNGVILRTPAIGIRIGR